MSDAISFAPADFEVTIVRIEQYTTFKRQDVIDLTDPALTQAQREDIVRAYSEAHAIKEVSGWDVALKILNASIEVANVVLPIANAVQAVLGAGQAAKALKQQP